MWNFITIDPRLWSVYGTNGNDYILADYRDDHDDWVYAYGGDDIVWTGLGDDRIYGGDGDDILYGDAGNDVLRGDAGDDLLGGGDGDDRLYGDIGNDSLVGNSGFDIADYRYTYSALTIRAGAGAGRYSIRGLGDDEVYEVEKIVGSARGDRFYGGASNDLFDGARGDDIFYASGGYDVFWGDESWTNPLGTPDSGFDSVNYQSWIAPIRVNLTTGIIEKFANTSRSPYDRVSNIEGVSGTRYDDVMIGHRGHQHLWAGSGDDVLAAMGGRGWLDGDWGDDTLYGGALYVRNGNGYFSTAELRGYYGNDTLYGSDGSERLLGGGGDDTLTGNGGDDYLDGGFGRDLVDYITAARGVTVNLATGRATGDGTDTLRNFENLRGSNFVDVLTGDDAANVIRGAGGGDVIWGGGGDDLLQGEDGADRLFGEDGDDEIDGGAGHDYVYGGRGDDHIWDFAASNDRLEGGDGDDFIDSGAGDDTLDGDWGDDVLRDDSGRDRIYGGGGDDRIYDFDLDDDYIHAGSGDDQIYLRGGYGRVYGGTGVDTLYFTSLFGTSGVTVRLENNYVYQNYRQLSVYEVENVYGSNRGDTLYGDAGANRIDGGRGSDMLNGRGGSDVIIMDVADSYVWGDVLWGQENSSSYARASDTFILRETSDGGAVRVKDFDLRWGVMDQLDLSDLVNGRSDQQFNAHIDVNILANGDVSIGWLTQTSNGLRFQQVVLEDLADRQTALAGADSLSDLNAVSQSLFGQDMIVF